MTLKFGSLFSGIGGFDLGLEWAGMVCAWQVEINPFCRRVLAKHWPHVPRYENIAHVGKHELEPVDLICGGWPCQPFSIAGRRRGKKDDRYLWPEVRRLVAALRPRWFLGENVPGIISMELDQVLLDLETEGYTAWPLVIPACAVDAPHQRSRVWIVAHADSRRRQQRYAGEWHLPQPDQISHVPDAHGPRLSQPQQRRPFRRPVAKRCQWAPEPGVGRVVARIPGRVDRLKALGNAAVPQVVEQIGRMILEVEYDY